MGAHRHEDLAIQDLWREHQMLDQTIRWTLQEGCARVSSQGLSATRDTISVLAALPPAGGPLWKSKQVCIANSGAAKQYGNTHGLSKEASPMTRSTKPRPRNSNVLVVRPQRLPQNSDQRKNPPRIYAMCKSRQSRLNTLLAKSDNMLCRPYTPANACTSNYAGIKSCGLEIQGTAETPVPRYGT